MEHRGGTGIDSCSGDGAGILTQIPDSYFRNQLVGIGIELPKTGHMVLECYLCRRIKHLDHDFETI